MNKKSIIKWGINIIIPILILCIPTTALFTSDMKIFFAITAAAIILIATENIPTGATALILPITYIIFLGVDASVAFKPWSMEIPWLVVAGFLITAVLEKTGLMKRLAYNSILLTGGSFKGIIVGILLTGTILSFLIADVTAKAVLIGALALSICKALNLELGNRAASAIGATAWMAVSGTSYLVYTGSTGNLVPFGLAGNMGVQIPSYVQYMLHMFVPQLVYIIICTVVILLIFKPEKEIESKEYFKQEKDKLGKVKVDEWKVIVIAAALIIAILTSSLHGISVGWLFVIAAFIMFLPGIKLADSKDFTQVKFPVVLFITACLCIGIVSNTLGVGQFVADIFKPILEGSPVKMLAGVWGLSWVSNFALTPLAAYSAFTTPLVETATALGINPIPVIYTMIQGLENVIFPYEYAGVLVLFGFGMMSYGKCCKFMAIKSLIGIIALFVLFIPWWNLVGLL